MDRKIATIIAALAAIGSYAAAPFTYSHDFATDGEAVATFGKGECRVADGVLHTRGAVATLGEPEWTDYVLTFKARCPEDAEQVQIWAGFRTHNRNDRYVVGIKGGLQDDLYLMRAGYMGTDQFLSVKPLGFHPEPGQWYRVRVEVCGQRIRVFVNDSPRPYIDIIDPDGAATAPCGEIALGGGWIDAEYDDVTVTSLAPGALDGVSRQEMSFTATPEQKELERSRQRAAYEPVNVGALDQVRTQVSLDGEWLFMPTYVTDDASVAASPEVADADWHVMTVPNFWTPIRIWLHGETMGTPAGHQHKGVSDTYYQRETDRCENYTFDYRRTQGAWYRQWVDVPAEAIGKRVTIDFDAVSKMADVYVNGVKAGTNIGMFGDFSIDASKLLRPGLNLIAVRVYREIDGASAQTSEAMENYYGSVRRTIEENKDDQKANEKVVQDIPHGFYGDNPAGIWQPVKLTITDPVKVEDVYIKPSLTGAEFEVEVANHGARASRFDLQVDITDHATGEKLHSGLAKAQATVAAGNADTCTFAIDGLQPKLWSPAEPNLYDFAFTLIDAQGKALDKAEVTSGFRTFESRPDGYLYLNGNKFWLRGGNHIPFAICPNDQAVADKFMGYMREGHVNSTRTHTSPWNQLWLDAADRNGIAVSFEGTWSWLMIHSTPIPSAATLDLWASEWLRVMKKNRNHPSVVFWTINNEMKFYDLDADTDRAKQKMEIISDVVKDMRQLDGTRPIVFDSNYKRVNGDKRFGRDFMATIDDGDIDDDHGYYNWYDFSLFRFFNGEFQRNYKTPGRPLISQEMSTGYPNGETGHPTRSYQLIHQNPYSLIGYEAYDWADPASFKQVQAFITGELAETLRRTGDQCSGIMHFAYMTWFRQCYDAEGMSPWPTYYAMQRAMQPVLVSAELWGRHFYAGERIPTRVYVVNDADDCKALPATTLQWAIKADGTTLAEGLAPMPEVEYYGRAYIEPEITIPALLPAAKTQAQLHVALMDGDKQLSANHYDVLLAEPQWSQMPQAATIVAYDPSGKLAGQLQAIGAQATMAATIAELAEQAQGADAAIITGIDNLTEAEAQSVRQAIKAGANCLLLNCPEAAKTVFPEYITSWIKPTEGDIVVMERTEHPVFDGVEPLELRYFNNNEREIPLACYHMVKAVRDEHLTELASQMKIHAYIDEGTPANRIERIEAMRGLALFGIDHGQGHATVSTLATDKAATDPVAARMLTNIIKQNIKP